MRTVEALAEEHTSKLALSHAEVLLAKEAFKAGYEASRDHFVDVSNMVPQWISVRDRLPEKDRDVLWYNPTLLKPMDVDMISPEWTGSLEDNTYSHWMPLPAPPSK